MDYPTLPWPRDGPRPPTDLTVHLFIEALTTFPIGTGLGWDGTHPRAVVRLSPDLIRRLVNILMTCELLGNWPAIIELVLIVLLPKTSGGLRAIGLFPVLPRHAASFDGPRCSIYSVCVQHGPWLRRPSCRSLACYPSSGAVFGLGQHSVASMQLVVPGL